MASTSRFLLVYGSQTGQSKAIAEELVERCYKVGIDADIHCLSKIEKEVSHLNIFALCCFNGSCDGVVIFHDVFFPNQISAQEWLFYVKCFASSAF